MKKINLLSLLLFFSVSVFSQGENAAYKAALNATDNGLTSGGSWIPGKSLDKIVEGSLYLFSNWNGQYEVITTGGDSRKIFNLNYNIKTQKIESFISRDSVFEYDLNQFDYVIKANKKYKVINDAQLNGLFLEVFNGKKLKLFRESKIVVEEGTFNPLTQEKLTEDKYVQAYVYYFLTEGKYEKTKLGKKGILKYLKDKEDLVKDFVSKNNLTYTSDGDVSKILNYYNLL
ncbi:MAG: hypothetical protein ABWZ56_07610 [Flavobacterium sp.]